GGSCPRESPPTVSVNALARQSFEQSRCASRIHGREAFGKSLIHGRKRVPSVFVPILPHAQPADAESSTQLPKQRVLLLREAKRLSETILGQRRRLTPFLSEQQLALDTKEFRNAPTLSAGICLQQCLIDRSERFGDSIKPPKTFGECAQAFQNT